MALEAAVEDVVDKGGLAAATDSCDYGHYVEGELHIYALEVVGAGTLDLNVAIAAAAALWHGYLFLSHQEADGVGSRIL